MRLTTTFVSCFVLTAVSALALDKAFVDQAMQSARSIERDAIAVSAVVRSKQVDAEDVKKKIEAMSTDIAALQKLVADFESTNPQLNERDRADWKLLKDKVQLLEIFHGEKQKLASEDFARNRAVIRAHATGVAQRAEKLQHTLAKLMRTPLS